MNRRSERRPLTISTLSPIHIGCGEDYEPSNFVIHAGLLHVLNAADLAGALDDADRRRLSQAALDDHAPIGAIQRFFAGNAERFAGLACRQVAIVGALERKYRQDAGRPTQGSGGDAVYNNFRFGRTAYRPLDGAPYMPGSALKGSIRTAWLNRVNDGRPLLPEENPKTPGTGKQMEQRLLHYQAGNFENDPFRHLALADAQPDEDLPPPTRILYAVSKRKRHPLPGEAQPKQELSVFLETIPEAWPAAFHGEIVCTTRGDGARSDVRWTWNDVCDACNTFYRRQLEAELDHQVLGNQLDGAWKRLLQQLLRGQLDELIGARQGFLLRVGRHSGAESVTLDEVRRIKILGPKVDGRQTHDYRRETTQKRFAGDIAGADRDLLPFGWVWVESCDDRHRHLADSVRARLAQHSAALREEHADRLLRLEEAQRQRADANAQAASRRQEREAAALAAEESRLARERELAAMSPNRRRVERFCEEFADRFAQLRQRPYRPNGPDHAKARALAREAAAWPLDERIRAADAIEEWLPKVVHITDMKSERKKLGLAALRANTTP